MKTFINNIQYSQIEGSIATTQKKVTNNIINFEEKGLISKTKKKEGSDVLADFVMNEGMRNCYKDRLDVLHKFAAQESSTSSELAKYRTKSQIDKYLGDTKQQPQPSL